ncbi:5'-methylthioadenosine/adenosylhomocysteine nucleosidase [Flavicella sp.]|uniref:5'-methylthioadenosine/adenosylhomocysteine nucleosidase n=1 Tax=Flavicella sp. TaxID=2957742 RepID=UPI003019BCA3
MIIGIISAMPEEVKSLIDGLKNVTISEKGMRSYYHGFLNSQEVVIVFSRWGKVASAITTTQLINDYNINEIIFTGVSGSLDPNLKIGDVILGTHLYQHDMDTRPLFNQFEIPLLGKTSFQTKANIQLEKAAILFTQNISKYISPEKMKQFGINKTTVNKGAILSGDQFISHKEKVTSLKKAIPDALCVEMEGASVAQVCYEYKIPFSIIRVISDNANDDAPIDFSEFTKSVACKYAKGIIENYINSINK